MTIWARSTASTACGSRERAVEPSIRLFFRLPAAGSARVSRLWRAAATHSRNPAIQASPNGYTAKVLTEMLGTKPGEIKALFKQTLEVDRARELKEQMLAALTPMGQQTGRLSARTSPRQLQ